MNGQFNSSKADSISRRRELGFKPPVWERGFSEVRIYGSQAVVRVREYIAGNPVKRRLVQSPAEYAYSSSNTRFELDEVPQGLHTSADSAAICPPNCLTISSFAPGAITISTLGYALARLRNGQLIGTPLPDLDEGPIGTFLAPAAKDLYQDTTKALGTKRYSRGDDSDRHPLQLHFRTLARLLHLVREQGHGGTLLVLPDEIEPGDGRLVDRLSIKYGIQIPSVWKSLIDEALANHHYYRLLFPTPHNFLHHDENASASDLRELIHWEARLEAARKRIGNFCSFLASLSAVDGAVVMTRRMRILRFGAEILAMSPSLVAVREARDPAAIKAGLTPIDRFGTRHRSAMRMCSSFEDCIALVVSQDGPVKAMKRVGADVVIWNDVTLGRLAI